MKTQLRCLLVLLGTFLCSVTGHSQINYTQNFNVDEGGWDDLDFYADTFQSCEGQSLVGEFYYMDFGDGDLYTGDAVTTSPSLGVSNGLPVTLTYSYKLFDYWDYIPLGNFEWGSVTIAYATSLSGPWTTIHTINSANHVVSADCAVKTATFTPAAGSPVYLKVTGVAAQSSDIIDVLFSMDNVSLVQQLPSCTGTPAASTATLLNGPVCNQQNASISLLPAYGASGLTYQWQGSANGTTYTNIAGATSATLSAPVSAGPWFRAVVTCSGSGLSTTSAAVQATSSGTNCTTCAVSFTNNVEPITSVVFSNLTNVTDASAVGAPAMQDFTALPPANVTTGQAYSFSAQGNTDGSFTTYIKVYIDFNKNGNLNDPGESFNIGTVTNSTGTDGVTATSSIFIPTNAATGLTLMRVYKLYAAYPSGPCANGGYGQVEDYLVNITQCTTAAPTAAATQTVCSNATVANLVATGTGVKWYNVASGGTQLASTTALTNNTTYYASQTNVCEGTARVAVMVNFTVVPVDDPADVTACVSYTLPALTNGVYRTATGGGGTVVAAGTVINATTTLYVYNTANGCSAENSFLITVSNPVAAEPDDVDACGSYTLPALTSGSYHTAAGGGGDTLPAGTVISQTTTLYAFVGTPICFDENSFTVTIYNPVADAPDDVVTCTDYVLPALTNGAYYTQQGGQGDMLAAGTSVNATTTLFVYSADGDCSAENSFTVTINPYEVDQLDDVVVCSEYALPALTSGSYYTEVSGMGDMLAEGDVITSTQTIYVYGVSEDNDACVAETSFTVTVLNAVADEFEDVEVCDLYTLPELSANNTYHTQTGGAGTTLPAGSVINSSMTIYVYAQDSAATVSCTDETSFMVTVETLETPEDVVIILENTATLEDLEIYTDVQGTVMVYATEDDAEAGTNPLSPSTEVTDDTVYYATVTVGTCTSEPFEVTVEIILDRENFNMANFSYHPNPVKDVLNLSYSENITGVEVYSLIGQKVLSGNYNSNAVTVNLSQLASGTYMVKVNTENASKTIKVIRE
ncbi:GEVED domain-containing protein [Flavobacterium suzhouense]|uniref:GEVED domain-containing protein n=1 Tax=Flavobacterium suzhouense TaxID=1529638 RepID=A0ABW5NYS2_9FLAO